MYDCDFVENLAIVGKSLMENWSLAKDFPKDFRMKSSEDHIYWHKVFN